MIFYNTNFEKRVLHLIAHVHSLAFKINVREMMCCAFFVWLTLRTVLAGEFSSVSVHNRQVTIQCAIEAKPVVIEEINYDIT